MNAMKRWLVGLLLLASGAAAAQSATIMPAAPRYLEPVYVRITPGGAAGSGVYPFGAQATMTGNTITVTYQFVIEIGSGASMDVMLGRLPAGSYTVNVLRNGGLESTAQFTVAPGPMSLDPNTAAPAVNYSDLWWNPAESGWGMSVNQGVNNQLFAIWFVYDATGNATWYTLEPGQWQGSTFFSGIVNKASGPYFGAAFDPSKVTQHQAGTGTLTFTDASHARFDYTIDGVKGSKLIEREPIQ